MHALATAVRVHSSHCECCCAVRPLQVHGTGHRPVHLESTGHAPVVTVYPSFDAIGNRFGPFQFRQLMTAAVLEHVGSLALEAHTASSPPLDPRS